MTAPLVVVGAGGHGREVIETVLASNDIRPRWQLLGVLDDDAGAEAALRPLGVPRLGPVSALPSMDVEYVIGIGDNATRRRIDELASTAGLTAATVIHPTAVVGRACRLAEGVYLAARSCLTTNVVLGRHAHVNVGASVSHDGVLRDYANLCPGVRLGGHVTLGAGAFLGIGATVLPRRVIGEWSVVGAGATVTRDLAAHGVYAGAPAKPLNVPVGVGHDG